MLNKLKIIGMKNLINLIVFVFYFQFGYSQIKPKYPAVMVVNKDSLVCFTTEQSKQIAVWNEQRKECLELQKEDKKTIDELGKISNTQLGIISNLEKEITMHKKTIEDKNTLLQVCEDEKKSLNKEIRKQRRGKWIAIAGGIGGVLLTTIIAIN